MSIPPFPGPNALYFVGDPHDRFEPFQQALGSAADRAEIWWIPGNHDFASDAAYDRLFGSALADRNFHARVVELAGLRVDGFSGHFEAAICHPRVNQGEPIHARRSDFEAVMGKGNHWRGGLPRKRRGAIWWEDYTDLCGQRADVLVRHEAPSCHPLD